MTDIYDIQKEIKLREHLNKSFNMPEDTERRLNEQLKELKMTKKRRGVLRLAVAVAAAVTLFAITAIAVSGNDIQFVQDIINRLGGNASYEEIAKYMDGSEITVTNQGYSVTINGIFADSGMMIIKYNIHSDEALSKRNTTFPGIRSIKINGKRIDFGGSAGGISVNEYDVDVYETVQVDTNLPESFKLDIEMANYKKTNLIENFVNQFVQGKWNFRIDVNRKDISAKTVIITPANNTKIADGITFTTNEFKTSPLSKTLSINIKQSGQSNTDVHSNKIDFFLLDENGKRIDARDGRYFFKGQDEGTFTVYIPARAEEYSKITIIPYTYNPKQAMELPAMNVFTEKDKQDVLNKAIFKNLDDNNAVFEINNLGVTVKVIKAYINEVED